MTVYLPLLTYVSPRATYMLHSKQHNLVEQHSQVRRLTVSQDHGWAPQMQAAWYLEVVEFYIRARPLELGPISS